MWNNFFRPSQRAIIKRNLDCVCVCVFQQGENPGSSKDWVLDPGELEAAFSTKTRMIIVSNPNNPIGKVATCIYWTCMEFIYMH